jgi:hypothetical protein
VGSSSLIDQLASSIDERYSRCAQSIPAKVEFQCGLSCEIPLTSKVGHKIRFL